MKIESLVARKLLEKERIGALARNHPNCLSRICSAIFNSW
jgi:hypothetical protein